MVVANVLGSRESLCQTRGEAVPLMEKEASQAFRRLVLSDMIGPLPCMSQRWMKLDVRCAITATFVCPPGGVNSGRSASLDMIHRVTHAGKEAPEGMRSS